ncbi:MAG: alpha/beta hydrolase [Gammaproteobacteria bacterium]
MLERTEFDVDGIHAYRYAGDGDYAILICHGGGGWGGMYDEWAYPYREQYRADIWSWDQVGFGRTGRRGHADAPASYRALQRMIEEIRTHHAKPIFTLGSSLGCLMASASLCLDGVAGAVAQCSYLVAGGPAHRQSRALFENPAMKAFMGSALGKACWVDLDQLIDWEKNYGSAQAGRRIMENPNHLSMMHLAGHESMAMFEPPFPLSQNRKPFMMMVAEHDPMLGGIEHVRENFQSVGGPTELIVKEGSHYHQLMFFHREWFSGTMDRWCRAHA